MKTQGYKGRMIILTKGNTFNDAISLGHYILGDNIALNPNDTEHDLDLFAHEYGHTCQSRIMGPLYLYRVGVASIVNNNGPVEMDANRRGFWNLGMTQPTVGPFSRSANSPLTWWEHIFAPVLWPFIWSWNK
jgi:hypothetical protein